MSSNDVLFTLIPGLFPRLSVPDRIDRLLKVKRSQAGLRWMMRNEVEESTSTGAGGTS